MDTEVPDVSTTAAPSTADTSAPAPDTSVPSTEGPSDKGYLDAVMSALQKPEEGSQPSEQDQKPTEPKAPEAKADEPKAVDADDPTEDELKNYSPHARKRIGQLLGQRKEYRETVERLQSEVEPLKAQAKVAQDLQSFVQTTGLTKEDLDVGFSIMGTMRSDPQQALAMLMPIVQQLMQTTGVQLPPDLQDAVNTGRITEDHARELSQTRAKSAHLEQVSKEQVERQQREEAQRQHQTVVHSAATAVSDWERTKSAADPDWHMKQERIAQLVELEVRRNGFPQDAKTAVALHQKALETVNGELRKFRPAPKPMQMASGHASPNAHADTAPNSYMEAALQGLQQARRQ